MTERMAVELIVFVEVPDDITEAEMDRQAKGIAENIAACNECGVSKPKAWLV